MEYLGVNAIYNGKENSQMQFIKIIIIINSRNYIAIFFMALPLYNLNEIYNFSYIRT